MEQVNVYNNQYEGPSYSVKYLGIVDGTMGILSRKMAMPAQVPQNPTHYKEVSQNLDMKKLQPRFDLCAPVLKGKSYATRIQNHHAAEQQERDMHAIVYSKKNSINLTHHHHLDELNASMHQNQLSVHAPSFHSTANGGMVEVVNVKIKDVGMTDYSSNTPFEQQHIHTDGRKSVDKTSNHDSPSRMYMRSLMDHSGQGPSPQRGKSNKKGSKQKQSSSMLKSNLKLTGKTIIEGNSINNLQYAVRAASKEGVTPPRNALYQLDNNASKNQESGVQTKQNSTMYSNKPVTIEQDYYSAMQQSQVSGERVSGYPKPELYNQHYINKYSFPKGLQAVKRSEEQKQKNQRVSLYDLDTPQVRKGISGWKLTKRPIVMQLDASFQQPPSNPLPLMEPSKQSKKKGKRQPGIDGKRFGNQTFIQELPAENMEGEEYEAGNKQDPSGVRRSVNQDNQLTNIKISYHNQGGGANGGEQFSGEAQPYGDNNSYQISPRTGEDHEASYSHRKLPNQYQ